MTRLYWTDPPKRKLRKHQWAEIAAELRARPGRWAIVRTGPATQLSTNATAIKQGAHSAFRPGGTFDACTRWNGYQTDLYARYIGDAP